MSRWSPQESTSRPAADPSFDRDDGRKSIRLRLLGASLIVVVLIVIGYVTVVGGGKVIDHQGAERFIDQDLSSAGVEVHSVECPVGVEVEPGVEFECEVVDDREEVAVVRMRIVDEEGGVQPISIQLAEAGSPEVR